MFKGDCDAETIANAAWQASDKMLEASMKVINDPTISKEIKSLVRIEIENQKRVNENIWDKF